MRDCARKYHQSGEKRKHGKSSFTKIMIPKKKKNKAFAEAAVKEASGIEGNLNHESSHETIWPNYEPEAETQHWSPCTIEFCTEFWISIMVVLLFFVLLQLVFLSVMGEFRRTSNETISGDVNINATNFLNATSGVENDELDERKIRTTQI